ncbi:MAG TPA: hypothetical protein VK982_04225, partial [Bacteroidales bacterium]|nr:hypothetical protein [Bacteroidales bacterium]
MADIIKLLFQAKIDTKNSIPEINTQIDELSKKVNKLDLKIKIDDKQIRKIEELNKKLNNLGKQNIKPINVQNAVKNVAMLKTQIGDLVKEYSKFGTVKTEEFFDDKGQLNNFNIQLKDANDNIQNFRYAIKDGIPELQGSNFINKSQENYNKTLKETVKTNSKLRSEQKKLSNDWLKAKNKHLEKIHEEALDENKKYNQIIDNEKKLQAIREKSESKYWMERRKETVASITQTPDGVKKLNEYYKELEKTTAKVAKEQEKLNKSQSDYWASVRKEKIEDLTNKPKELKDMSKYYKEQEKYMSRLHSQALAENKIYDENQVKIKTLIGTFSELKKEQLEVSDVANILSKQYGNLEVRGKSLDQVTGKYTVTLKKSAKENLILKGSVDKATGALRVQNKTVEQAKNVQLGFWEQMRIALERVPIWLGATTLYFQSFRFLKQLVTDISDINQVMIELE